MGNKTTVSKILFTTAFAFLYPLSVYSAQNDPPVRAVSSQTWGQLRTAAPDLWAEGIPAPDGTLTYKTSSWFATVPLERLSSDLAGALKEYRTGVPSTSYMTRASTLSTGAVELSSTLLDYHAAGAQDQWKAASGGFGPGPRGPMIVAYQVQTLPTSQDEAQKLFAFAKALNIPAILVDTASRASLESVDKLATENNINVFVSDASGSKQFLSLTQGQGSHIGACIDPARWTANDTLAVLKGHPSALCLRATPDARTFDRIYKAGVVPAFVLIDYAKPGDSVYQMTRALEIFEDTLRPTAALQAEVVSQSQHAGIAAISPLGKEEVIAATPDRAPAVPQKPRVMLVMDLNIGHRIHISIPYANQAVRDWAEKTHAYTPVFSNDLENLKYPNIKKYDAIFLSCTVGQVFVDPEIRASLLRFVREGGGLIGYHGTAAASLDWPEFGEMTGGVLGNGIQPATTRTSVPYEGQIATLRSEDPASPITKAFAGKEFYWGPEEYYGLNEPPFTRDKFHVLLSIDPAQTDPDKCRTCQNMANDVPVAWIRDYGKGRIFFTTLGHWPRLFTDPRTNAFMLAGIQFALGDLAADTTPSAKLHPGEKSGF